MRLEKKKVQTLFIFFHNDNARKMSIKFTLYSANFPSAFSAFNVEALHTGKCRQKTFLLRTESFEGFASAHLAPFIQASPTFYSSL